MLLTPHTIVGVAVATSVGNPLIAVPASFILHFVGDMVPHWDFYSNTTTEQRIRGWRPLAVMADLAIGVATGVFFTLHALWVMNDPMLAMNTFMCGVASVLPDVMTGPTMYIPAIDGIFDIFHKIQSKLQFQAPLPWGIISQIFVSLVCLLLIASLRVL